MVGIGSHGMWRSGCKFLARDRNDRFDGCLVWGIGRTAMEDEDMAGMEPVPTNDREILEAGGPTDLANARTIGPYVIGFNGTRRSPDAGGIKGDRGGSPLRVICA